ncbi:MAG: hypothetical protein J5966_09205, partial [Lachnospiraceae bacterium]|nr:hypothetical protein [Lachnospiraceae bacterium]
LLKVTDGSKVFRLQFPYKDGLVPVADIATTGNIPLTAGQTYTLTDNMLTWKKGDTNYIYTFEIVPGNATNKKINWEVRVWNTSTNQWEPVEKDEYGNYPIPGSSDQNAESEYQLYATIEDGIDKGIPFTKSFEQTVREGAYSYIVVDGSEYPYYSNEYAENEQLFATNDKNEIAARLTWGTNTSSGVSVTGAVYSVMQKYFSGDGDISAVNWTDIDSTVINSGMYNIPVSEFLENKKNYIYGRATVHGSDTHYLYESSRYITIDTIAPTIQINSAEMSGDMGTADLFASDALSGVDTVYLLARESTSTAPGAEEIIKKGVSVNAADVEISTAGLDPSKKYVFYAVAEDKAGNLSTVAKKTAVVNPGTVSANITVNGKVYDTLQGSDKLGDTVTEPKEISISANVSEGLIKSVQYYISDKFMASESEIEKAAGSSWASYNDSSRPYLKSNQLNYIYAKITQNDDASTVTYISTQGILENETVDASIEVNGKTYDMLQSTDATDTYLNSNKAITINAVPKNNSETGKVKSIQYYISQTYLPSAEAAEKAAGVNWSTYDASAKPMLKTNQLNYVYAKITQNDKAGTATYVSTKGIWEDETAPSVTEIKETANDEYTEATVKVTGSDNESGLKTYYLLPRKKTEQVPDANTIKTTGQSNTTGTFKVSPISKSDPYIYYAVVEDKAGNISPVANQSGNVSGGDVSATIKVLDKSYKNLNSSSKIGGYTNENKTFSISADSKGSPVKSIEYYISDKLITSTEELIKEATTSGSSKSQSTQTTVTTNKDGSMTVTTTTGDNTSDTGKWTKYNDSNKPYLKKNQLNYIYARVTQSDTAATKTYVSTEGIWEDEVKPTATSVKGTPKDTSAEVTVKGTDKHSGVKNYYLMAKPASDAAPSDAEAVKSGGTGNETGKFNLSGLTANTAYSLYAVVEDNAGNLSDFKKGKMTTKKAAAAAGAAAGAKAAAAGKSSSGTGGSNASKRKSSSSDKAAKGSNSSSTNAEAIRDGVPFIDDASEGILIGRAETSGWDRIESETDKAKEADWISVDMNGSTVVPKAALAKIAGRDVTCYFEMNDDVTWAVNGLSFDGVPEQDIDFRVRLDTRNIPARLIKEIADVYPHTNVTLEHNGPFGFTAILSLYLGEQGDGMYSNLYYYNEEDKGLEFVESSPVDGSGRASFEFTHASDYTVIVRGESLTSKTAEALAAANLDGAGGTAGGSNGGINGGPGNISRDTTRIWLLVVSVISLVLCGFILFMPDKRRRRGRYQGA